jgi:hypothetical protein
VHQREQALVEDVEEAAHDRRVIVVAVGLLRDRERQRRGLAGQPEERRRDGRARLALALPDGDALDLPAREAQRGRVAQHHGVGEAPEQIEDIDELVARRLGDQPLLPHLPRPL